MEIMRLGKNKIHEEILWGVGMGLGLENVRVWVQTDSHVSTACTLLCIGVQVVLFVWS